MRLDVRVASALLLLCVLGVTGMAFAEDQKAIEEGLNAKLKDTTLVLRTPRVGTKLRFDIDGQSKSPEGIRGFDDKVQVTHVDLRKDELLLKGVRLNDAYDSAKHSVRAIAVEEQLEIRMALKEPNNAESISAKMDEVFRTAVEIAEVRCPNYEYIEKMFERKRRGNSKQSADSHAESVSVEVCVPSGTRGWASSGENTGLLAPKMLKYDPPDYVYRTDMPSRIGVLILIDAEGKITDGVLLDVENDKVVRTLTKALKDWRFKPAEKDNHAVASVVHLSFDFQGWFRSPPRY